MKDKLIARASEIITSKYPQFILDPALYDVTAWENSKKTIVKYKRIIKFTPLKRKGENIHFDFEIDLTNNVISPFDFWGFEKFYFPTAEEQEKIDFVIQAFGLPHLGFNNRIVEDTYMYHILIDNKVAFGKYFIDKTTGKECMRSIQGSYTQPPNISELNDTDPLIEIK